MEASETSRGRNWLSNFAPEQQVAAKRLLDAIELVGQDQFRNGLVRLISRLPNKAKKPIALVPVREMATGQNYFGPDKNASPRLLNSGSFPGSEGIVANVLGALRRQDGNEGPFVAAPSLKNMRAARCRTVLYVDDFSGSGKRILDFHRSFMASKTIKSWKSYGLVKFHVAVFAATPHAREVLKFTFGNQNVHVVQSCPTFSSQHWTPDELAEIRSLCAPHNEKGAPFGFRETGALLAFTHTAPNNLPAVLWKQVPQWHSFFEGKAVPSDILPLFGRPRREFRIQQALLAMGQKTLSTGSWRKFAGEMIGETVLVLAAIASRKRTIGEIAAASALTEQDVSHLIDLCRRWGLISPNSLHITDTGLAELRHARSLRSSPPKQKELPMPPTPYYPTQLRVGR